LNLIYTDRDPEQIKRDNERREAAKNRGIVAQLFRIRLINVASYRRIGWYLWRKHVFERHEA